MGLFGLFTSIVGLGAMVKDRISDDIHTQKNFMQAKANGFPTYFGSGCKEYYTKTEVMSVKEYVPPLI